MTGFIIVAALLALLAVLFVILPLLRARPSVPVAASAAMIAALGLIGVSAITYALLGSPASLRVAANPANAASGQLTALARRVEQAPQDLSAWLALAQAYGSNGEYLQALHDYQRANDLANGGNATALAGMGEAILLLQGLQPDSAQAAQASADFERALQLDPKSPKALFYSALIAYRAGRLEVARARFAAMLTLTPPPPQNVRVALQNQIDQIDAQLHPRVDPATAIHLRVTLAPALAAKVPANASLFVFVQAPGGGAPLAVKRANLTLPEEVDLSAADAMIAQRAVQPGQKVTVVARISASGSPLAQRGDLYGQIDYVAGKTGPRALQIDKLSP